MKTLREELEEWSKGCCSDTGPDRCSGIDRFFDILSCHPEEEPLVGISTPDLIAELERRKAIFPAIYYGREGGLFEAGGKERDLEKAANYRIYIFPFEDFKETV